MSCPFCVASKSITWPHCASSGGSALIAACRTFLRKRLELVSRWRSGLLPAASFVIALIGMSAMCLVMKCFSEIKYQSECCSKMPLCAVSLTFHHAASISWTSPLFCAMKKPLLGMARSHGQFCANKNSALAASPSGTHSLRPHFLHLMGGKSRTSSSRSTSGCSMNRSESIQTTVS